MLPLKKPRVSENKQELCTYHRKQQILRHVPTEGSTVTPSVPSQTERNFSATLLPSRPFVHHTISLNVRMELHCKDLAEHVTECQSFSG